MRTGRQQKAALTRAVNSGDKDKIRAEVKRTVNEWETGEWDNNGHSKPGPGFWPDNWTTWNIAFSDTYPVFQAPDLRTLIDPPRLALREPVAVTTTQLNAVYLTVWSGGYDVPQYQAFTTEDDAMKVALDWVGEGLEDGDTVDVLRIGLNDLIVTRIEAPKETTYTWGGEGEENEAYSFLFDEYLERLFPGYPDGAEHPSQGDMVNADEWATEQMLKRTKGDD